MKPKYSRSELQYLPPTDVSRDPQPGTQVDFLYHSVTDARNCLLFGPGLLGYLATMEEVTFFIQARDDTNTNRTTGEDEFDLSIRQRIWEEDMEEPEFKRVRDVTIEDMEDGSYMVRYTAPAPGEYIIECEFKGTFGGQEGGVRGQPCTAVFDDYAPRSNNSFNGELMKKTVEEDVKSLSEFAQATLTAIQSPVQVGLFMDSRPNSHASYRAHFHAP